MDTDDWLRPLPHEFEKLETGLGKHVLSRILLTYARPGEKKMLTQSVQEDLAWAGPQGVLSLIRALLGLGAFTREEMMEFGTAICGPRLTDLFEELLDLFESGPCWRDLCSRDGHGRYQLSQGPC